MAAGEDLADPGQLLGKTRSGTGRRLVGNRPPDPGGDRECHHRQREDDFAPAGKAEGDFEGFGRGEGAETARRHDPAGKRRLALGREPLREGLERGHQAGRDTQPDQRAPDGQAAERGRPRESGGADRGNDEEQGLDPTRAKTVEQHAEGQLGSAEGEEIGAGEQAEGVVAEAEVARQHRSDDRVGGPVKVGKKVAGGERQEQPDPELARIGRAHGASGFTWNAGGGWASMVLLPASQSARAATLSRHPAAIPGQFASR